MTHFERLGLPVRFAVEPTELERGFLAASRTVHPDHHVGGQNDTAAVNAAYHTLRDPVRRAEYLLELRPGPTTGAAPVADPVFLMEMMAERERAEAGDTTVAADLAARLAGLLTELGRQFAAADDPAVRRTLATAKTVRSLLRQVASD